MHNRQQAGEMDAAKLYKTRDPAAWQAACNSYINALRLVAETKVGEAGRGARAAGPEQELRRCVA
jgi:hypothetical protein